MVRAGSRFASSLFGDRWRSVSHRLVPVVALVLVATLAPDAVRVAWAAPAAAPGPGGEASVPVSVGTARHADASQTDGPGVTTVDRKTLPRAGSADVATNGVVVSAGGLPVSITALGPVDGDVLTQRTAARGALTAPSRVQVAVAEESVARAAGVAGVVFTLGVPTSTRGSKVRLRVDYSSFANAFGAGYGERLRLVRYPDCVLSEPGRRECHTPTDLGSVNKAGSVYTQLALPGADSTLSDAESDADVVGAGVVLALMSESSSAGATSAMHLD